MYLGSSSGLLTTADWTVQGDSSGIFFGHSVAGAGDINGDGFDDVLIGAPSYSNGESSEGVAFVYLGSSSGLSHTAAWIGESNRNFALFGGSVAGAGDVNDDGYADVIVGAEGYANGEEYEGAAFVYLGSSLGLSLTAAWMVESDRFQTFFGTSVGTAGDVNGDGASDVIVGAWLYDNSVSPHGGGAFVYLGSRNPGLDSDSDGILDNGDGSGLTGDNRCTGGETLSCDDNCRSIPNEGQADSDADGVGTVCDNCPTISNSSQADFDLDGMGDACESGVDLADIDGTGRVDGYDLARLGMAFGSHRGTARYDAGTDLSRDDEVGGLDLSILGDWFGTAVGQ